MLKYQLSRLLTSVFGFNPLKLSLYHFDDLNSDIPFTTFSDYLHEHYYECPCCGSENIDCDSIDECNHCFNCDYIWYS